jgi:hypothetical protein
MSLFVLKLIAADIPGAVASSDVVYVAPPLNVPGRAGSAQFRIVPSSATGSRKSVMSSQSA